MPVLCIGPICIPMNLLLPFLLGLAHHYGFLKWVKREWVTLQHWRQRFAGTSATNTAAGSSAGAGACPVASTPAATGQQKYVCEGGVCRLVPADAATDAAAGSASAADDTQAASKPQIAADVRQRHSSSVQGVKAMDL